MRPTSIGDRADVENEAWKKKAAEEEARRKAKWDNCVEKRKVLEEHMGGDIQQKLMQADSHEKAAFLKKIFREFDEDGSGGMDMDEFFICLQTCGFRVSKAAALAIMTEVDVDGSGTIDLDEFLEFFRKIDDLEAFRWKVEKVQYQSGFRKKLIGGYIFALLAMTFGLCVIDIQNEGKDSLVRLLLIVFSIVTVCSLGIMLVLPVISMKLKPTEKLDKLKKKAAALKQTPQQGGTTIIMEEPEEEDEVKVDPPHGAVNAAHGQYSYRQKRNEHDQPSTQLALGGAAWAAAEAPPAEENLQVATMDQLPPTTTVAATRQSAPKGNYTPYHLDGYDAARQMMAQESLKKQGIAATQGATFTPWSQSRYKQPNAGRPQQSQWP